LTAAALGGEAFVAGDALVDGGDEADECELEPPQPAAPAHAATATSARARPRHAPPDREWV
jgi:hypothetical protein